MLEGRYSTIATWDKCKRMWYYQQIRRLVPRVDGQPLRRGTLVHKGFEASMRFVYAAAKQGGTYSPDAYATQVRYVAGTAMLDYYLAWQRGMQAMNVHLAMPHEAWVLEAIQYTARALDAFGVSSGAWAVIEVNGEPLIERRIEVALDEGILMRGTLDFAAERRDGTRWIVDLKTHARLKRYEEDGMNAQTATYQWLVWQEFGLTITGTAIFQIKAAIPKRPGLTQAGKVSKANIATDRATYRSAVIAAGQNLSEYKDKIESLPEWDQPVYTYRSVAMARNIVLDQIDKLRDMNEHVQQKKPYPRSMEPDKCARCVYQEICYEELSGRPIPPEMLRRFKHNVGASKR